MDEKIKELITFIAINSEQESSFLYPNPGWNINSHSLLKKLQELYTLEDKEIDDILILNQPE